MFIDIDYNKEKHNVKIELAKPNKEIIANLSSKHNDNVSFKLGNIFELNFSVPHQIERGYEVIHNPEVDLIKEKMLLRLTLGKQTEWFIIDEINENGSDSTEFEVKSYSLGYQLSHKRIGYYQKDGASFDSLVADVIDGTPWFIGSIDSSFGRLARSFEFTSTNALDAVIQIADTFGALIEWDSNAYRMHFRDLKKVGQYKGLSVDYGRLLKSISRTRTTDEMVTRLYVEGNDGMSIQDVNPTGQSYIEDFSFFMNPFRRDANRKVIEKSHFMSDNLCHAILDHTDILHKESGNIKVLVDRMLSKQTEIVKAEIELKQLELELNNLENRLDTAKAVENQNLISSINSEISGKSSEINKKSTAISALKSEYLSINLSLDSLRARVLRESNFTDELIRELQLYTIEREWKDDRYLDSAELYSDALDKFIEMRQPKIVLTVDIDNLFDIVDEQIYWDRLTLGDMIKVRYPQMKMEYMARIIQIDRDIEDGGIKITIANTKETGDEMERIKEILSKSQSASTILENNRYKWGKVSQLESTLEQYMNATHDANKRKITAGVNNQIEIGNRGIIIKNPDDPLDMVIMQSGIIALSRDGGENWSTAITPQGIIAEQIIGKIILGHKVIIEDENGIIKITGNLIEIFDHLGDARVQLGEYEQGVYGMRIDSGSIEIVNGLPKNQMNPDAVFEWDSAEGNAKAYADGLKSNIDVEIRDIYNTLTELDDVIEGSFRDGIIDEAEAIAIKKYINLVGNEKSDIDSRFVAIYNMTDLTGSSKTALNISKTAYDVSHSNLIYAINTAISDSKATADEITDVNNKFADYRSKLADLASKFDLAIDSIAQAKANRAESNANTHTNNKDNSLRTDLRLTAPLPTSITMNTTGITAYTTNSSNFARMDYRGLYVQGGALDLRTSSSTSSGVIINGSGISAYNSSGSRTFFVDTNGNMTATSGTFSGALSGATGTFSGNLSAAGGTFSGNLSGATGTFSGNLSAAGGTFTGSLSGVNGTFSGTLQGATGTFSGELRAATGTFNGIYSGTISANQINATTLSAISANLGRITSADIDISSTISVGNGIYLRGSGKTGLYFNGTQSQIYENGGTLSIEGFNGINMTGRTKFWQPVDFNGQTPVGLNLTAVFG